MGLTIHYSGSFRTHASLEEMIDEVEDIVKVYKWDYHILERRFPTKSDTSDSYDDCLYGICFTPPESETVTLTFLSNRRMSDPVHLQLYGGSQDVDEQKYLYMLFTKTQYAGVQTHILIVHLLKYISKKYFAEFSVTDEGQYWETEDVNVLEENFRRFNAALKAVGDALENIPKNVGETLEDYFVRVLRFGKES